MIDVYERYLIDGSIEEFPFDTEAIPVDAISKADGYELEAIIGALTMEQWEIKLDPKTDELVSKQLTSSPMDKNFLDHPPTGHRRQLKLKMLIPRC
jgi:hypothetical protein